MSQYIGTLEDDKWIMGSGEMAQTYSRQSPDDCRSIESDQPLERYPWTRRVPSHDAKLCRVVSQKGKKPYDTNQLRVPYLIPRQAVTTAMPSSYDVSIEILQKVSYFQTKASMNRRKPSNNLFHEYIGPRHNTSLSGPIEKFDRVLEGSPKVLIVELLLAEATEPDVMLGQSQENSAVYWDITLENDKVDHRIG